jgi:chromosome segregation ATPase
MGRTEQNHAIIIQLLKEGKYPSVAKVHQMGGKGSTQSVQEDVRAVLMKLVIDEDRPPDDISEEVYEVAKLAVNKAWESLKVYEDKADRKVADAEEQVKLAKVSLDAVVSENSDLLIRIKQIEADLKKSDEQCTILTTKVNESQNREELLRNQLRSLETSTKEQLEKEREHQKALSSDYERMLSEAEDRRKTASEEFTERLRAEAQRYDEMDKRYLARINELQSQLDSEKQTAASREKQLVAKYDKVLLKAENATKEAAVMESSLSALKSQTVQLDNNNTALQKKLDAALSKATELETTVRFMASEQKQAKLELEDAKQTIKELRTRPKKVSRKD